MLSHLVSTAEERAPQVVWTAKPLKRGGGFAVNNFGEEGEGGVLT